MMLGKTESGEIRESTGLVDDYDVLTFGRREGERDERMSTAVDKIILET